jgi:hypothetical protein
MSDDELVDDVLASVVPLGGEATPQAEALGDAVARQIAARPENYSSAENYVAGRLSTMPPFDTQHPSVCLPYARAAIDALNDWEPEDS